MPTIDPFTAIQRDYFRPNLLRGLATIFMVEISRCSIFNYLASGCNIMKYFDINIAQTEGIFTT